VKLLGTLSFVICWLLVYSESCNKIYVCMHVVFIALSLSNIHHCFLFSLERKLPALRHDKGDEEIRFFLVV
jgi:hypothetical protein